MYIDENGLTKNLEFWINLDNSHLCMYCFVCEMVHIKDPFANQKEKPIMYL